MRKPWLAVGLVMYWATMAWAQTPTNWTNTTSALQNQYIVELTLTMPGGVQDTNVSLLPLTTPTLNNSIQGYTLPVNYTNVDSVTSDYVVYISCDDTNSFISASQVFANATANNPRMVILYSLTADYCTLGNGTNYPPTFSIKTPSDIQVLLASFERYSRGNPMLAWTYVKPLNGSNLAIDEATGTTDNGTPTTSGASPTTRIAMIILYTITGVITFLFLAVIVTGAVRAHRHPERYGLRAVAGRPRRSRAHGLARAMLDSLPIVKFGERDDTQPKPTEVELGTTAHGPVEVVAPSSAGPQPDSRSVPSHGSDEAKSTSAHVDPASHASSTTTPPNPTAAVAAADNGIAPAASALPTDSDPDTQGCSICTDDFERGQDQRVLPCNHRFHPACVDPWLLNVSGTCPLCRIDLHPRRGSDASSSSLEDASSSRAGGTGERNGGLAPPLGEDEDPSARRRLSIRRSILIGLMGFGGRGPETMSRDERVRALRALRGQQAQRRRREAAENVEATAEEEHRAGSRLRAIFRPRRERNSTVPPAAVVVEQTIPEEGEHGRT